MRAICCTSRPMIFKLVWNLGLGVAEVTQDFHRIADRRQRIAHFVGEQRDKLIFLTVGFFELCDAIL